MILKILKDDATRTYDNYEKCSTKDLTGQLLMKVKLVLRETCKDESYLEFVHSVVLENRFAKFTYFLFLRADIPLNMKLEFMQKQC